MVSQVSDAKRISNQKHPDQIDNIEHQISVSKENDIVHQKAVV